MLENTLGFVVTAVFGKREKSEKSHFVVIRPHLHFYLLAFFMLVFILNFRTLFVYIFACAPHFSFVKSYRLIAKSLCF